MWTPLASTVPVALAVFRFLMLTISTLKLPVSEPSFAKVQPTSETLMCLPSWIGLVDLMLPE